MKFFVIASIITSISWPIAATANHPPKKHQLQGTRISHNIVGTNINDLVREVTRRSSPILIDSIKELPSAEQKNVVCLALSIYHEARSLTDNTQKWVAYVAINRLNTGDKPFGKSLCEVINQRLPHMVIPQYSFLLTRLKNLIPQEQSTWIKAQQIAYDAINSINLDPTHGSKFFWNPLQSKRQTWMNSGKEYYALDLFIFMVPPK